MSPRPNPPLPVRTAHLLSRLGRTQSSRFVAGLEPLGVRAKHFALLNHIALAQGSSQKELGRRLGLDPSGLVASLDELERDGLVERRPYEGDRRRYALHLTGPGQKKLAAGRKVAQLTADRLLASLSEEEMEVLHGLLDRIAASEEDGGARFAA